MSLPSIGFQEDPPGLVEALLERISARGHCPQCAKGYGDEALSAVVGGDERIVRVVVYHLSCREAGFVGLQEPFRDGETIRTTHRTVIARLGKLTADGVTSSEMPVLLVHPGLETITIRRDDSGQWLIADLDRFREQGYTFTRFPLPEERNQFEYRCQVRGDHLIVPAPGGGNYCPTMSDDFAKALFDFGGVSVVVSSTWEPAEPTTGEVMDAILEGREFAAAHFSLEEHTLAS